MTIADHFMRRTAITKTLQRQAEALSAPKCTVCGCDKRILCQRCREHRCSRCEGDKR